MEVKLNFLQSSVACVKTNAVNQPFPTFNGFHATGVARGVQGVMAAPIFLAYLVIFCDKRRYPEQKTVVRLKSNILVPPNSPQNI